MFKGNTIGQTIKFRSHSGNIFWVLEVRHNPEKTGILGTPVVIYRDNFGGKFICPFEMFIDNLEPIDQNAHEWLLEKSLDLL